MELVYHVKDKPSVGRTIVFALQQLLSILAGTVTLPLIVGNGMSQSAALFGACIGTLIYLIFTKFKSPVLLGSSFTFLGSMSFAFAGAATAAIGYLGLLIGALLAGLVYVILSIIIRFTGTGWVNRIMPPVIVGPIVAVIALTLAPDAMRNIMLGTVYIDGAVAANEYVCLAVGFFTMITIVVTAIYGKKMFKLIPFIIGILSGYALAATLTGIGYATNTTALLIIDFSPFQHIKWIPDFAFINAFKGFKDFTNAGEFFKYLGLIAAAYVPVALTVFSEHIADHKNISHIIEVDLLEDPGLSRTLMGDGVGSMIGAFFGGCPNTTYGESISTIAFSKNASIITIFTACLMGIVVSFFGPLMTFFSTIPPCVVGGLSICLYGFIAISGFQMLQKVDIGRAKNIFVASTVFVVGIGGLVIEFDYAEISSVAVAFVAGLIVNQIVNIPQYIDEYKTKKELKKLAQETSENQEENKENTGQ